MRDHTFRGVPVGQMSDQDLNEVLAQGDIKILSWEEGGDESYAKFIAMERLRIERLRRDLRLPLRGADY